MERKKKKHKYKPNEIESHRLGMFMGGNWTAQVMGRGHVTWTEFAHCLSRLINSTQSGLCPS